MSMVNYSKGIDMDPIIKAFYEIMTDLHAECKSVLSGLTPEQLDWRPFEDMNSIAVLAAHIAGAEKFWVGDCVMLEPSNRDRPGEFATEKVAEQFLADILDSALQYVHDSLTKLSAANLDEPRPHPRDGSQVTIAWALNNVLQHTALHLGHMQVNRELLQKR